MALSMGREMSNDMANAYGAFNIDETLDEKSMALMFLNGDGGNTGVYKENLAELGLFQGIDPDRIFEG